MVDRRERDTPNECSLERRRNPVSRARRPTRCAPRAEDGLKRTVLGVVAAFRRAGLRGAGASPLDSFDCRGC